MLNWSKLTKNGYRDRANDRYWQRWDVKYSTDLRKVGRLKGVGDKGGGFGDIDRGEGERES